MGKPRFLKKKAILKALGYDLTHWVRVEQNRACLDFLKSLGAENLDAMEISGGDSPFKALPWKSYTEPFYPDYDICAGPMDRQFDVIILDHVFPHLLWPYRAARNIHAMLKPGGAAVITSSFLIRVNYAPVDCSRWTELGLRNLLIETGFKDENIQTGAWGNRWAVITNLFRLGKRRGWFRPLRNEPNFPTSVWAFARKES